MFGRDWESCEATIVAEHVKGGPYVGQNTTREWVADVHRADGTIFRATIQQPNIESDWENPVEGSVVSVLVEAKGGKVKFDKSDPRLKASTAAAARAARFQAAQQAPVGSVSPAVPWGPTSGNPVVQAMTGEVQVLSSQDAAPLLGALFSGDADGRAAAIEALQAQAAGTASAATPEQRIAQLAALKEKGVLTDAEYTTQRQKIIDEI